MSVRPAISGVSTGLSRPDRIAWHQPGDRVAVRANPEGAVGERGHDGSRRDPIQVTPVVVLLQVFPARPSSIPDIRDFVRRCLAESPLTEEGNREVSETVFRALLDAAGPTGYIQVAFRIFPEHVEVDVLHSDNQIQPPRAAPNGSRGGQAADRTVTTTAAPVPATASPVTATSVAGDAAGPGGELGRHGAGSPRPPRHLRGLDVDRAAPGGPDPGGRRPACSACPSRRSAAGWAAPPSRGCVTCAASRKSSARYRSPSSCAGVLVAPRAPVRRRSAAAINQTCLSSSLDVPPELS